MARLGIGLGLGLGGGGSAGGVALVADKATYLTSVSAGALIATLTDPYGSGSTFTVVGSPPAALALASAGRIVAGAGAQSAGQSTIVIRAAKGGRAVEEPLIFTAQVPTGTPTPTPTITISAAQSKAEGNSGATLYTYTVTRSTAIGAVLVPWSFNPGGTNATDFTGSVLPSGGNVSMADGVTSGIITISVSGDVIVEGDETFTVLISTPAGYVAGSATSATGTILNDDSAAPPNDNNLDLGSANNSGFSFFYGVM